MNIYNIIMFRHLSSLILFIFPEKSHKKSKTGYWQEYSCVNGIRFEKAVLSDFHFAVQMSPKSNCIWTADNRMGGEVSCSSLSIHAIKADIFF